MANTVTKKPAAEPASNKYETNNNKLQIKGVAAYPKLDRPYKYDKAKKKSLPDPTGVFSVKVVVGSKEAKAYIKQIDDLAKAAGVPPAKAKNMPYAPETDKEGEETGNIVFTAKGYGTRRDGSPNRIQHWTASGNPVAKDFRLGAGSIIRVDLWAKPFKELGGGVRLNLNAVQVLKAVEYEAKNPFARDDEYASDEDEEYNETDGDEEGDTESDTENDADDEAEDF